MPTHRMSVGRTGESIAASFLERRGGVIIDRNVRVGRDEIDLLVLLDGERVAVEVKTTRDADAHPEDNFDDDKERYVRRAARNLSPPVWRVDLVAVVLNEAGATVRWLPEV
jgi:putative endonuclease